MMEQSSILFNQYITILETLPTALIILDEAGKIVLLNQQVENMFGYSRQEIIDNSIDKLIPVSATGSHAVPHRLYFTRKDDKPLHLGLELSGIHHDGYEIPVEIHLTALTIDRYIFTLMTIRNITAEKRAQENQAILSAMVEYSNDAIVGKNLEGIIFSWNKGAEKLYGYKAYEVIGKNISFLYPPEYIHEHKENLIKILQGDTIINMETYRRHKNKQDIPISITISPIKNAQGKIIGYTTTARDITKQKLLEEELRTKNNELANANLAKDTFLANMSHELRTPLNAILGFTGTLLMQLPGPINPEQKKQLKTVEMSAKHLLSIINDILDVAKIESGKVELNLEDVNCNEIIEEVKTALIPFTENKNIEFKIEMPKTKIHAITDRRALLQILINLSSNAIKFTEQGYVLIKMYTKIVSEESYVVIDVRDTGIGIQPEFKEKIFMAFEQVYNEKKHIEGTGLGLYLSQKLASLIKGRIQFESVYGEGSCFSIYIPMKSQKE